MNTKLTDILRAEINAIADCTGNDPAVVEAEAEPLDDPMDQMEILPAAKPKPSKTKATGCETQTSNTMSKERSPNG